MESSMRGCTYLELKKVGRGNDSVYVAEPFFCDRGGGYPLP